DVSGRDVGADSIITWWARDRAGKSGAGGTTGTPGRNQSPGTAVPGLSFRYNRIIRGPPPLLSPAPPTPLRPCEDAVTPREVLALLREKEVKAVDLRFMDFPGLWKHVTIPAEALDEHAFEDGIG